MSHPRLSLALATPGALPDTGRIALFGPRADTDLSDLPRARLCAVQGFRPDYDALVARGIDTVPEVFEAGEEPFAAAVVFLPRAKVGARALLALAATRVARGGPVWVDGQKTDGVDSLLKDLRALVPVSEPISKAHGKIFRFDADPAALREWEARPEEPAPGFVTWPGLFSAGEVDRGSALLAACLPASLPGRVADLGAGWGWLSAEVLKHRGVTKLGMIEADRLACACAERNVADPRARAIWADVPRYTPEERYGAVVMNPPFHIGRAADPELGQAFIRAAAGMLSLSGTLWMVANRHLPYDATLRALFHEVEEITPPEGRDGVFRVIRAARPVIGGSKRAPAGAEKPSVPGHRPGSAAHRPRPRGRR